MRKSMMLTAMAMAAIAFGGMTATAMAGEGVYVEDSNYQPCPEVQMSEGEVTGGCVTEDYEGSFELGAFMPNWTLIGTYGSTFDLVLDGNGDGYAVNPEIPWNSGGVARKACDEADGTPLPWAVESRVVGVQIHMDITVGLKPSTSAPGGFCTQQVITVEVDNIAWDKADLVQVGQSANIKDGYWSSDDSLVIYF
jgi:hypothetical protein